MKTCRRGHIYGIGLNRCPYCKADWSKTPEYRARESHNRKAPERRAREYAANRKRRATSEYKVKQAEAERKRLYKISSDAYYEMFVSQGCCCALCGSGDPRSKSGWATDHCHDSGRVRGILCHPCNLALGLFKDNPEVLRRAAEYLEVTNGLQ